MNNKTLESSENTDALPVFSITATTEIRYPTRMIKKHHFLNLQIKQNPFSNIWTGDSFQGISNSADRCRQLNLGEPLLGKQSLSLTNAS